MGGTTLGKAGLLDFYKNGFEVYELDGALEDVE